MGFKGKAKAQIPAPRVRVHLDLPQHPQLHPLVAIAVLIAGRLRRLRVAVMALQELLLAGAVLLRVLQARLRVR